MFDCLYVNVILDLLVGVLWVVVGLLLLVAAIV